MIELFEQRMKELLKDDYNAFKDALEKKPVKSFYLNPKKKNAIEHLNQKYITSHPYIKDAYYYDYENYPLGKHPYFNCGLYYIQEPSAMAVANCLEFNHDDYVLDMCGAPGGKSCAIASRLGSQGLMITNDINTLRAKILSENIERFGLKNTIVTNCDPIQLTKVLPEFFDKIILDAPCSGEGMFRKDNQAIETWSPQKVQECTHIQRQLMDAAMKLLKPGGILIYSTCTYNTKENEEQINYLLKHYDCQLIPLRRSHGMAPGIHMDEAIRLYPHRYRGEGHFIACIQKNGQSSTKKYKPMKASISKQNQKLVNTFYQVE